MSNFYFSFLNHLGLFGKNNSCASSPPSWRKSNTTNLGFALLLVSFLLSTGVGFGQSTANYVFTTSATSSMGLDANGNVINLSAGTTPLVAAASDQGVSTLTPIGFNFVFYGSTFSQFSVSANGILQLGSTLVSGSTYVASGGTTTAPKFSAMGSDGQTASIANGGGVVSKVVGTGSNRCLVIQWVTHLWYQNTTNPATFQIRLYETTGVIEYVYGEMNTGAAIASAYSVGFSVGTLANQFASISTSTNAVSTSVFNNNVYTVNTNIANLHSTSEGSRRSYTFTPPSIVSGDASNVTFTAVAPNGLTVNWQDNATNEVGFLVTRATDAAFTQNVATFAVPTTTSAAIGTAYNLIQTGLGAGTAFYYRVSAAIEGGLSAGITGNASTLAGATYFWTGATGGNWNTFANWNTAADGTGTIPVAWDNSDAYIIDGEGTTAGGVLSIAVDRASFTAGQVSIVGNTNLTLASNNTTTRTITISGGPNDDFVLEVGSSLNLISATNAVAFAFSGSGNTGLIAGTYIVNGSTSNVINSTGGTGTLVIVASTGSVTSSLNSSSAALVGSIPTLRFENGSNYNHGASTTVNYIPTATWLPNATATLNGNTTGTSLTSGSTSLGNLVINTTLSTVTLSAFTSSSRIIQGNLTINSTGTGRFRAVTSGLLQINGNLIVNGGIFEAGNSASGGVIVKGNTTVAVGATLDLNQSVLQNEGNLVNNGAILSSETTTSTSSLNFLGTTVAQTLSGTGTFTGRVSSLGVSNPLGLTISAPVLTQRVNLFSGTITGSSNITIGTGLALAAAVQIGSATNTTSGGNFDVSPVFNLGTGPYSLLYLGETTARTTGIEVPSSRSVANLTVNNANGLTISGGTIEVVNGLTLTNGIVTSTLANHIIHGTTTAAGTLTGGSVTSYINGPIVRAISNTNTAFALFPVGKAQYSPVSLAPTTTAVTLMRAEAFDSNTGTASPSIINLTAARRWQTALVSGAFTDIKVRLADALIVSTNIPVQATSAAGVYTSSFGSTATFTAGTPNVIEGFAAVPAADFTGFLSFADSNACSGTPTPGNTIASSNGICFGSSVNLSLQNIPVGSGITYQWKSSTDGITYAPIAGATNPTLTVTPTVQTFYLADVTCATGSVTGSSTAIQITFASTVVNTTPGSRCGLGTVNLNATGSASSNISWYANASGGSVLANGTSFTTPTLTETTTYFAAAEQSVTGTANIGAGLLTSSSVGISFLSGGWGGVKTQYIIRASELAAAGVAAGPITSLGFEPTTAGQTYTGFSVSVGATSQNVMTTAFIATGLSQVYLGTLANDGFLPVPNTVNNLAFGTGTGSSSSFVWDGTSNIVVSISRSSVPNASNSTGSIMKYDATGFTSTAYDQADNLTPAQMLASATADLTTSNRPRFIINGAVICSSPRVPVVATVTTPPTLTLSTANTPICNGATSAAVTITSNAADYDTYTWSPSTNVSGNSTTGWVFNPTATTTYTLTATQSSGNLCAITTTLTIVVNPLPSALSFSSSPSTTCLETAVPLTVTGGTSTDIAILSENFNGTTNSFTTVNNTTGATDNSIPAWTLKSSGFVYSGITFVNSDASQFYLSNSDAAGSGNNTDVSLISPSFSTVNFSSASLTFNHFYQHWASGNGIASVAYSLDNGSTWINIQSYTANTGAANNFAAANLTLPAAALNQANVRLRFRHVVVYGYYWAIDNIAVRGTQVNAITWSPVTNLFTDAAATVAYTNGVSANTVYFKSSSVGATTYSVTATTVASCTVTATATIEAVDCSIPYANLQFPGVATIGTCTSPTYYARVYKAGVTEAAGQGAGIQAWIGKHTANTDPATWPESSWQLATFNVQSGNDDEYQATFAPSAAGTYYVASRFVFAPGNFVFGGYTSSGGGIWNGTSNVSGVLTVEATAAPTASAQIFCNSGTVADLVATGTALQWYTGSTGGTALASTTALASGDYYVSQTLNNCEGPRTMVAVTVNVTAAPTASAQTFCNSGTVADLVATGTALQWYAGSTGGTALASTTALASGDYYVSQTLNACEGPRTMVAVTVNVTAAPTASAQTFCNSGSVADLVATGTALQWYAGSTGGTALASTTALASGDYYVSQTLNACEGPRTMVAVTVNVTAAPTASAQTFCNTATVANLVATGTALQWYAGSIGGTALASTTALASGNYYVSQTLNGCEGPRSMVVVTVNVTAAPTASAQTFCNSGTVADLVATGTALQWYAGSAGGTALASTTALASGNYYVSQTLNACESPRTMVVVTVNAPVAPTFTAVGPICSGGASTALPTTSTNGVTGTWSPALNNTATTTYTFTPDSGQCASTTTMTIVVNVTAAPTGVATQDFTTGQTLANFTVNGSNIIWYSSATGSTVLPSTTVLVSGVIYYASQTINGCESTTRLAVTAGVNLKTPGFEIRNLRYYPNPVQDILTVDYSETIENVQMYNMLGQMVYNRNTNASKVTIEMTNMAAGNYILQVTVNGITKNVKVIKK